MEGNSVTDISKKRKFEKPSNSNKQLAAEFNLRNKRSSYSLNMVAKLKLFRAGLFVAAHG